MLDFDKPMRVKRDLAPLQKVTWPCAVVHDNGVSLLVHGETGKIYKFMPTSDCAENIPEPKRRYQAQYSDGSVSHWTSIKYEAGPGCVAWLIETDHGEGAEPRYTYEREESGK